MKAKYFEEWILSFLPLPLPIGLSSRVVDVESARKRAICRRCFEQENVGLGRSRSTQLRKASSQEWRTVGTPTTDCELS